MKISEILKLIQQQKKSSEFIPTGVRVLDKDLDGGFLRKEMIVIGGFTGCGKSFLASQLMWNFSQAGFKTSLFSLEISKEMIVRRMLGSLTGIKPTRLLTGSLDENEKKILEEKKSVLVAHEEFFEIYDDIYEWEKIKEQIACDKSEVVIIDFIQNVITRESDQYIRLSRVALEMQQIAKSSNSCIVVLSQLSNKAARRGGDDTIVEYRGSGTIAQVCDLGFWLSRDDMQSGEMLFNLRKNRRGFSGLYYKLRFANEGGRIVEDGS